MVELLQSRIDLPLGQAQPHVLHGLLAGVDLDESRDLQELEPLRVVYPEKQRSTGLECCNEIGRMDTDTDTDTDTEAETERQRQEGQRVRETER
jgi:hypothetical protein